jgi:transcriptional regulator with XRE-family HTH domain
MAGIIFLAGTKGDDNVMKTLGDRIKALRLPGETQAQFAERLGTTQASISRYLNGRQPDRETLIKISRRTSVSLDWLLTGSGSLPAEKKSDDGTDQELIQAALAYISDLRSISSRDKTQLVAMIRDVTGDKDLRKRVVSYWEEQK